MLNKDSLQTFFPFAYQYHFLQTYLTSLSIDVGTDSYKNNICNFIKYVSFLLESKMFRTSEEFAKVVEIFGFKYLFEVSTCFDTIYRDKNCQCTHYACSCEKS